MANRKPTEKLLAKLPRKPNERASHPDRGPGGVSGGYIRVPPIGSTDAATYYAVARVPGARNPKWHPVGKLDVITIEEARDRARPILDRIRQGLSPTPEAALTFEALARKRLKIHVERVGLRTADDIVRRLERYAFPHLGHLSVDAIRKSVLSNWADGIVEHHGARTADLAMSDVIATLKWHATRTDDFEAPSRLPRRVDHTGGRDRVLDENEIRVVWQAAEGAGQFGGLVRCGFLTMQRPDKVLTLHWTDIDDNGLWTIRTAPREKNNAGTLRLPPLALDEIRSHPMVEGNPYVFAGARGGHYASISYARLLFDKRCTEFNGGKPLDHWTLHDLRRSGATRLAELGVSEDVIDYGLLAHARGGVKGVYNRAKYDQPKTEALALLASYIRKLVDPNKVIPFARTAG